LLAKIDLRGCHKIPPERKERQSVMRFLIELAEELENNRFLFGLKNEI